jgi:hypothetical protein
MRLRLRRLAREHRRAWLVAGLGAALVAIAVVVAVTTLGPDGAGGDPESAGRLAAAARRRAAPTTTTTAVTTATTTARTTTTTAPPAPTTTAPAPPPPSAAAGTAGLSDPGALTGYDGPSTIEGGTVVIDSKRFSSRLTVAGGDVTIRNSSFAFDDWYHLYVTGGTVTVDHSEFDGLDTTTHADDIGVTGANVTVRSSRFVRLVNGLRLSSNSVAEGNVITRPNDAYGPAHSDGIEVYDGAHVVIRSNVIDITGGSGATGCVNIATDFGDIDDVLVEDNDLTGGTYSLYARLQGDGDAISGIRVLGNRWHTPHQYGTHSVDPTSSIAEWSANTLDGQPVPF